MVFIIKLNSSPDTETAGSSGDSLITVEKWTGSSSKESRDRDANVRRKSSEMSSTMKSRLEAFEREAEAEKERLRKASSVSVEVQDEKFREKLNNFQKISSQTDLKVIREPGPPPPLSYSKLIEVIRPGSPI